MALLYARGRQRKHEAHKLNSELESVICDSSSSERIGRTRSYLSISHSLGTQSTGSVGSPSGIISSSTSTLLPLPLHYFTPSNFDTSTHRSFPANLPYSISDKRPGMRPPEILIPYQPTLSMESISGTIPMHSTRKLMDSAANGKEESSINCEQAELVSGLWDTHFPSPDSARAGKMVSTGRVADRHDLWSDEVNGEVRLSAAPPGYDHIYDRWD